MKFTANRLAMLSAVKTVLKLTTGQIQNVQGAGNLLLEADSDTGIISLVRTDLQNYIQKRLSQEHIIESGGLAITPRISDILNLLQGEFVTFETIGEHLQIRAGNTRYELPYMKAEKFPKLQIRFPDETICVKGLNSLIKRTVFAAQGLPTEESKAFIEYVHISCAGGDTQAQATNGRCAALAGSPHCSDGKLDFVVHSKALHVLSSVASPNEELFVGVLDQFAVFMKADMFFAAHLHAGNYVDVGLLFNHIKPAYQATADVKELYIIAGNVSTILMETDDPCINLRIERDRIVLQVQASCNSSQSAIRACDTIPTPEKGFNYQPQLLLDCLKYCSGPVRVSIDAQGFLLLEANHCKYLVSPRGPARVRATNGTKKQATQSKKKNQTTAHAA